MKCIFNLRDKRKKKQPKYKLNDLLEQQIKEIYFRNLIQQIGLIIYTKLLKS